MWASLFASVIAGFLVVTFVDAISLERDLGPIKKAWPMVDNLTNHPQRSLKITVAALPVAQGGGGQKAPGSGEAMALSGSVRVLAELGVLKSQIKLSYAQENGERDWEDFLANQSDRLILGGPVYCKVTNNFLNQLGPLSFREVNNGWRIFHKSDDITTDAIENQVDYGLIAWHRHSFDGGSVWWILLAGLGTHGVIAAGEVATSRRYAEQILESVKGDFSNVAVLVRCSCVNEFIVDSLEVTKVVKF